MRFPTCPKISWPWCCGSDKGEEVPLIAPNAIETARYFSSFNNPDDRNPAPPGSAAQPQSRLQNIPASPEEIAIKNTIEQLKRKINVASTIEPKKIQQQIDYLNTKLSPDTQSFFARLLTLPKIGHVEADSPIIVGDLDGSAGRMILLAIQAGLMLLNEVVLDKLVFILNAEAAIITKSKYKIKFYQFQENKEISANIEYIINNANYYKSKSEKKIIFIGDCCHDRFSSHKLYELIGREVLHACGAIFIRGNHDCYEYVKKRNRDDYRDGLKLFLNGVELPKDTEIVDKKSWEGRLELHGFFAEDEFKKLGENITFGEILDSMRDNGYEQYGGYALNQVPDTYWNEHVKNVFVNCLYYEDKAGKGTLITHNGIRKNGVLIQTAFGEFSFVSEEKRKNETSISGPSLVSTLKEFVEKINKLSPLFGVGNNISNFRPQDETYQGLNDVNVFKNVCFVHGHDGAFDDKKPVKMFDRRVSVLGVNSRCEDRIIPVAVILGS